MGSKYCMNHVCRGTTSSEWKKGWSLKSGGFANLCYRCGSAYENSVFCETFHSEESGWRECRICAKRIHCGCIASRYVYMDFGGVGCITCLKRLEVHSKQSLQIPSNNSKDTVSTNGIKDVHPGVVENRIDDDKFSTQRLLQLTKAIGAIDGCSGLEQLTHEDPLLKSRQSSTRIPNLTQQSLSSTFKTVNSRPRDGVKNSYDSLAQPSVNFSLMTPSSSPITILPFPGGIAEGSEQSKGSLEQALNVLPKPPKPSPTVGSEVNKGTVSQARVARPPAEGRGRNQLLPRYWPRITDQELQQLSGDLKSIIVPLFEKVLSASDAGRIGRLVLPKACAEAFFPLINQSEGIPIRIQDITGKEWTFQFRFWPNNNSRMYVLEGVTPCIQNMQVQAGDTVTFSRIEPGGQLVIGCRKAINNGDAQDSQTLASTSGDSPGETSFSGATGNLLLNGGKTSDDSLQQSISERKKLKNIKNKRLHMHTDEAMELRITWEEAQELLRPSPTAEPTVVVVEDHEFEEFEEPPIFGKRTVFTSGPSGEQDQLAQCDSCLKWRILPVHALLSAKWSCSENIWDLKRCSCPAPEDIRPKDLEPFVPSYKESKRRKVSENKMPKGGEPSGLDALATAAVLGDNISDIAESSVGATTRHPRHRPGCTCIVCIQPPSGKGKHEPSCKCNVCQTVRRRFKTLMMRKKKRQSEVAQAKDRASLKIELGRVARDVEADAMGKEADMEESSKGQLDLNCDPHREDEMLAQTAGMSLTTLVKSVALPLDTYLPPAIAQNQENLSFIPADTDGRGHQ
ncbi:B3 domain-containing transcription repressor VAL1-like [Salvia splendens]|uniref:B3 domain-containing transcription repressor VAL1-like n=1 Tax=Salvia splendens TaxID=180675 RepID=UPI001C2786EC|nr:B3 domain-containing transcription repressor VAL1-like [Salvia splendens]XP_042045355.1 B3 domain-containing transcription repressor VAL1-like [Salvia splendens]